MAWLVCGPRGTFLCASGSGFGGFYQLGSSSLVGNAGSKDRWVECAVSSWLPQMGTFLGGRSRAVARAALPRAGKAQEPECPLRGASRGGVGSIAE